MTSLFETEFDIPEWWFLLMSDTLDIPDWWLLPTDLEDECGSFSNEVITSSLLDEPIVFAQSFVKRCERNRSLVPLSPAFLESINIGNHATTSDRKAFGLLMDFKRFCSDDLESSGRAIRDHLRGTDSIVQDLLSRPTSAMEVVNETLPEAIAFLLFMRDVRRQRVSKTMFLLVVSCLEGRGLLCRHAGVNPTGRYLCYRRVHRAIVVERRYPRA